MSDHEEDHALAEPAPEPAPPANYSDDDDDLSDLDEEIFQDFNEHEVAEEIPIDAETVTTIGKYKKTGASVKATRAPAKRRRVARAADRDDDEDGQAAAPVEVVLTEEESK
jgi:hypothetical protein